MSKIKIGWGHEDITPQKPVALRGHITDRYSQYVRDALTVTALAVESEQGECVVMVSCDIIGVNQQLQDQVREKLKAKVQDLDTDKVFLFGTHTHNAPYISEERLHTPWGEIRNYTDGTEDHLHPAEYNKLLVDKVSDAVVTAWNSRQAGGISGGFDYAAVGQNRRVEYADGSVKMYGKTDDPSFRTLEGPVDNSIELMFLWDDKQNLTGIAVNIACPSQICEGKWVVTADYWHEVRVGLQEKYGKDLQILPMIAPSGDVVPKEIIRKKHLEKDVERDMKKVARKIIFVVDEVLPEAKETISDNVPFEHVVSEAKLPLREISKEEAEKGKGFFAEWSKDNLDAEGNFPVKISHAEKMAAVNARIAELHYELQQKQPFYSFELHVVRIGDFAFTTNPFELYTDYGLRIKARSEAKQTFNIQLACDSAGYLPTEKAVEGGGYGAWIFNGKIGPKGGDVLVEQVLSSIEQLWNE